jgi:hypothetical protein
MLTEFGFKNVKFYRVLDGVPYDQNACRLVAVAEK